MRKATFRWTFILLCGLLLGPAVAYAASGLRDGDGGQAVTLLVGPPLFAGLGVAILALGAAAVLGALGSAAFSLQTGTLSAGLMLAWTSWRMGTMDDVIRRGGSPVWLAIEAVITGVIGVGVVVLIEQIARQRQAAIEKAVGVPRPAPGPLGFFIWLRPGDAAAAPLGTGLVVAVVTAAIAGWIVTIGPLKGQAMLGTTVAALAAGFVAQSTVRTKGVILTPALIAAAVAIVGVLGPVAAMVMHGGGLREALYAGQLVPLAYPIPLDWVVGALFGGPLGLSFAGLHLDARQPKSA